MNIKEIITDSLTYPLSDWKRFFTLGIILLISIFPVQLLVANKINFLLFIVLGIIGSLVVGSFVRGYFLKIISNSLKSVSQLPEFKNWNELFINGIKVFMVNFIYFIPVILIFSVFFSGPELGVIYPNLLSLNLDLLIFTAFTHLIAFVVALLYMIMIIPVILLSIANMAYNNGKFSAAFKFEQILFLNVSKISRDSSSWQSVAFYNDVIPIIIGFFVLDEIIELIYSMGWKKLIVWYITTGVTFFILTMAGYLLTNIISTSILRTLNLYSFANSIILLITLISLFLIPYLTIFLSRSTALIYDCARKSYSINNMENYQLYNEIHN